MSKQQSEISAKKAIAPEFFPQIAEICFQLNLDGKIIGCYLGNDADIPISPRDFLGLYLKDLLPESICQELLKEIFHVRQNQQLKILRYSLNPLLMFDATPQNYEVRLIPGMGSDLSGWVNLNTTENSSPMNAGGKDYAIAFISNITEQQREIQTLQQSNQDLAKALDERTYALSIANEQLWETIFELQKSQIALDIQAEQFNLISYKDRVGLWDWDLKKNIIYIDPILKSLLGYRNEEIGNNWDDWQAKIHPEDVDRLYRALSDYGLGESDQFELEYRMFHKDGTIRWFLSRGSAIKRGKLLPDRLIASSTDITDHKAIEAALSESDQRFRSIFNQAAIGIAQVSLNGQYLQVNQKLCEILGYADRQLLGQNFLKFVYNEDVEKGKNQIKAMVTGEISTYSFEQRYLNQNRQVVWANITASVVRDVAGKPKYFIQVVQDISDRRKAEFALEYSESRYRAIVEDQTELVCRFFLDGTLIFVNNAYANYFNQSYHELIGTSYFALLPDTERQLHQQSLAEITPQNPIKNLEYSLNHPNGKVYWQQWSIRGFFSPEGDLLEFQGVGRDITDRVQAEAERDRFFSLSLDLLCIASFDGYFKRLNPAWTTTLGYSIKELLAKPFIEFSHPEDRAAKLAEFEKLKQGITSAYFENRYLCKDGSVKWIAWSTVPFPEEGLVYAVGRDITEQKKVEAQIQASLEEKEVLLKEVHHRVKNNLQIVCSLLELQSQCSRDAQVIAMFKESQARIRSMSLVHEILYQSNDLGNLNFGEYIREISLNLSISYGYSSKNLQIQFHPETIFINLDTAIQCGLILNELLTNAFKYAFIDKASARIKIELYRFDSGKMLLVVEDNGIGLPANFNVEKTQTLGWQVIRALTRKLKGELKIESKKGTKISLNFFQIKQRSAKSIFSV
jgi:PAS domain S-box-containing protein